MNDVQNKLVEILRNEFGITTMKQLDNAIKNAGMIDISAFCGRKE